MKRATVGASGALLVVGTLGFVAAYWFRYDWQLAAFGLAVAAFTGSLIISSRLAHHFLTQMLAVMGLVATVILALLFLLLAWYFHF